jgi:hypothetical protein
MSRASVLALSYKSLTVYAPTPTSTPAAQPHGDVAGELCLPGPSMVYFWGVFEKIDDLS